MSKTLRKNQLRKSVAKTKKKYILYGGTASINIDFALRKFAIIKPEDTNLQKYIASDHDLNTLKKYIILNTKLRNSLYGYLFITPPTNYKDTDTKKELLMKIKEPYNPQVFLGVKVGSKWELKKLEHKKGNVYIYTGDPKTEIKKHTQVLQPKTSSVVSMSKTEHYKKAPSNVKTNIKKASKRKGVMSKMFKCFGAESCNESDSEEEPTSDGAAAAPHEAAAAPAHGPAAAAPAAAPRAAAPRAAHAHRAAAHGAAAAPAHRAASHGAAAAPPDDFSIVVVSDLENTFYGYTQEEIINIMVKIFELNPDDNVFTNNNIQCVPSDGTLWFFHDKKPYFLTNNNANELFMKLYNDTDTEKVDILVIYKTDGKISTVEYIDKNKWAEYISARFAKLNSESYA